MSMESADSGYLISKRSLVAPRNSLENLFASCSPLVCTFMVWTEPILSTSNKKAQINPTAHYLPNDKWQTNCATIAGVEAKLYSLNIGSILVGFVGFRHEECDWLGLGLG